MDGAYFLEKLSHYGLGILGVLIALFPGFKLDDEGAVCVSLARHEAVAGDGVSDLDGWYGAADAVHLVHDLLGALHGCCRRHVDHAHDCSGVFVGHEGSRGGAHEPHKHSDRSRHGGEADEFMADEPVGGFPVPCEQPVEHAVERIDETALEHAGHSEKSYRAGDHTEQNIIEAEPSEHEEYYCSEQQQRCHDRRHLQPHAFLIGGLHGFSSGRVCIFHALLERGDGAVLLLVGLEEDGAEGRGKCERVHG